MKLTHFLLIGTLAAGLAACGEKKPTADDVKKDSDAAMEKLKEAAKEGSDEAKKAADVLMKEGKEEGAKALEASKAALHDAAKKVEDATAPSPPPPTPAK